jgi:N-acetylneuraminic acid mutarotase
METFRSGYTVSLLTSGKVLVMGGDLGTAEVYAPESATWTSIPAPERSGHTASVLPSGEVLIAGGGARTSLLGTVQLYDPTMNTWTNTGHLAAARHAHTATVLPSGKVLVVGGKNSAPLSSAEVYDPETGLWTATGSLSEARYGHTATLLSSGKVLVIGGRTGSDASMTLNSAEVYDPDTGSWSSAAQMSTIRINYTATAVGTSTVMVVGGHMGRVPMAGVELYLP